METTKVNKDQIIALGLTGQMHGLVLLDDNDQLLRPAIIGAIIALMLKSKN